MPMPSPAMPGAGGGPVDLSQFFPRSVQAAQGGVGAAYAPAPFQPSMNPSTIPRGLGAVGAPRGGATGLGGRIPLGQVAAQTANLSLPLPPTPSAAPVGAASPMPPMLARPGVGGVGGVGAPPPPLPPPPGAGGVGGWFNNVKAAGMKGNLARFGGLGAFAGGVAAEGFGNSLQEAGYGGGRPIEVFGQGAQLGAGGAMAASLLPGVSAAALPVAATVGTGLMVGDTGGQALTGWLPGQIRDMEGKSNLDLLSAGSTNPAAWLEGLDRFGDLTGIGNFGNFKDRASRGQRSLEDVPFENIPGVGGLLDGLLGDGGQGQVDAAAATQQAQQAQMPRTADDRIAIMSRLNLSPETQDQVNAAFGQQREMLMIQAEQGMLMLPDPDKPDDPDAVISVGPEGVDDVVSSIFMSELPALLEQDRYQQDQLARAAAFQAGSARHFDQLAVDQGAMGDMYGNILGRMNLSPSLRGALTDYLDVAKAGAGQQLIDQRQQASQIPYVEAMAQRDSYYNQLQQMMLSKGASEQQSLVEGLVP